MVDRELLDLLACPKTGLPLELADPLVLTKVNEAISAGSLSNQVGRLVGSPLESGLVCQDRSRIYPVIDGIPVLLKEEAILLDQIDL